VSRCSYPWPPGAISHAAEQFLAPHCANAQGSIASHDGVLHAMLASEVEDRPTNRRTEHRALLRQMGRRQLCSMQVRAA
jgi:hypothetical protein